MAGVKISNLPAIVTPALTDVFAVVQAGVTYKETITQLQTLLTTSSVSPVSVQNQTYTYFVDTGAVDAYVITPVPATVAAVAGQGFDVLIANSNTGPCTLNPNGLGAESIKMPDGTDPLADAILAGMIASFEFDGTNYQLLNASVNTVQGQNLLIPNITGVIDASNAVAGSVGEVISSSVLFASATALVSGAPKNVTSIALTPGDWMVEGNVYLNSGSTATTNLYGWISTVSATFPDNSLTTGMTMVTGVMTGLGVACKKVRVNVAVNTTVYLSAYATFGVSCTACGNIEATRIR